MMSSSRSRLQACVVVIVALLTWVAPGTKAQQTAASQHTSTTVVVQDPSLKNAADKGLPLTTVSNVADHTFVEAVLIPASLAKRIFGKEVSQNYAAVELIISNRDPNAALIVQSVFLDYSQWLLSGVAQNPPPPPQLDSSQAANLPWQVASVESRLVRGELLDAQQWTARNWTIRALTALGSAAAGFQFPFSADVSKGVAAYNGIVVPAASTLWPDGTVNQVNRISDVGFQTNKVIPKQASDILVAFFPIDRFLTPSFKKIFLKNPAGFFVPGEMLADPAIAPTMTAMILPIAQQIDHDVSEQNLSQKVLSAFLSNCPAPPGTKAGQPNSISAGEPLQATDAPCRLQTLFNHVSLNSLRVVVGGVMTVNVATVPATIYGVDFKDGNTNAAVWNTTKTERQGTITGLYLSGGTPSLVDENGKAIDGVTIQSVSEGSTDTLLNFKMTLDKCIPSSTEVFLVVKKQPESNGSSDQHAQAGKSVASTPYQLSRPAYECPSDSQNGAAPVSGSKPGDDSHGKPQSDTPKSKPGAAPDKDGASKHAA